MSAVGPQSEPSVHICGAENAANPGLFPAPHWNRTAFMRSAAGFNVTLTTPWNGSQTDSGVAKKRSCTILMWCHLSHTKWLKSNCTDLTCFSFWYLYSAMQILIFSHKKLWHSIPVNFIYMVYVYHLCPPLFFFFFLFTHHFSEPWYLGSTFVSVHIYVVALHIFWICDKTFRIKRI